MRPKIIGFVGILMILALLSYYFWDIFNFAPFFMGKTQLGNGYVIENKIVPKGKGASHKILYEYYLDSLTFQDHYYSNKEISSLEIGDSIQLEISIDHPEKNRIVGYYK